MPSSNNPYLMHLTNGAPNLDWLWSMVKRCLFLWIASSVLIQGYVSNSVYWFLYGTSGISWPLTVVIIVVLLTLLVLTGTQLTFAETQKEQFALLRLTNIAPDTIFWCLVLSTIYRTRRWILWIIGGCPVLIWLICIAYKGLAPGDGLVCFVSPLANTYCYFDGPTYPSMLLEVFWFLSVAISVLSVTALATLCSVGLTFRSRRIMNGTAGSLLLAAPLLFFVILVIAPEGFLLIDTVYRWNLIIVQVLIVGIVLAGLPVIALLLIQYLLRRWILKAL